MNSVSTPGASKRHESVRLALTYDQLKQLSLDNYPVQGPGGKVSLSTAPDRPNVNDGIAEPYRFKDASPDAPRGFGVRVGKHGARYEVSKRVGKKVLRWTIGHVDDMPPKRAYDKARETLATATETGSHPNKKKRAQDEFRAKEGITLRECIAAYIKHLEQQVKEGKVKPVSVESVRDSLARLEREEVGLAKMELREISEEVAKEAFRAVRRSAQKKSNAIPKIYADRLEGLGEWNELTFQKMAELGIPQRYFQRIKASGLAAAEHTLGDAIRAIDLVVRKEEREAFRLRRQPAIFGNPLRVLIEDKEFRKAAELREHYKAAETRNPLGERDGTLAKVLKVIVARRDEQGGHNRGAADYLLLTLLFGARRGETARLKWYDKCTKAELIAKSVSWVWLAKPDEVNPHTKKIGSQAFFHDTKSGEVRHIPIGYFAERILRRRMDERDDAEAAWPVKVREAQKRYDDLAATTKDARKLGTALIALQRVKNREPLNWVFPARNQRSKAGHYSDSKSIIKNVRRDAGMLDLDKEIDIGLTPHDLRRTLGRYASVLFSGRVVSQLLHHKVPEEGMATVSERYSEQEWENLRDAMLKVEEHMIASSPRVWNRLKGADKPWLDEANDPPVEIFAWKQEALT